MQQDKQALRKGGWVQHAASLADGALQPCAADIEPAQSGGAASQQAHYMEKWCGIRGEVAGYIKRAGRSHRIHS